MSPGQEYDEQTAVWYPELPVLLVYPVYPGMTWPQVSGAQECYNVSIEEVIIVRNLLIDSDFLTLLPQTIIIYNLDIFERDKI